MNLLQIDEQHTLSFQEATMNMLVLGGIGRGKTTNFMLPVVQALIADGHAGLIVDVKNNFAAKVRRMATYYGREQDVVEIGNRETATPVNIIRGLQREEVKQVIKPDTANMRDPAWAFGGWKQCCDVIDILHFTFLKTQDRVFEVSLALLSYLMNDIAMARGLFDYFKNMVYDDNDFEQFCLVERIDNEMFHMLNAKNESDEHYSRHVQWELINIRESLRGFVGEEKYIRNFSCSDSDFVLDFHKLLHEQNKIVVLRFDNHSSDVGQSLAALTKVKLYADIYRSDPTDLPRDHFTFQVIDEFQDVFLPAGGMGDLAWFAKSREFNHINVISCQSLSSLYRGAGPSAVHELVTNCSSKAILQTEDLSTTEYFKKYPLPKPLFDLSGSEAYFTKFDLATRSMVTKLVDLTEQHARSMEFQSELARLALPSADQHSQPAHKERVVRLRKLIGMPFQETNPIQEDAASKEEAAGGKKDDDETMTVTMEFPDFDFKQPPMPAKRQYLSEYQLTRRRDAKRRVKAGWCPLTNPGGFLRMDRKASRLQARKSQRERAKARAVEDQRRQHDLIDETVLKTIDRSSTISQAKSESSHGVNWKKATEAEKKDFMERLLRQAGGEDAGVANTTEKDDSQSALPAIVVGTGTNRKQ